VEAVEAVHLQDVADGHLVVDRVPAVAIVSAIEKAHAPHHAIEFAGIHAVAPARQATASMTINQDKKKSIRT